MKKNNHSKLKTGFTIVELLVIVVIIGILATLTIVSYSGIQKRAAIVTLKSDLANVRTQLAIEYSTTGNYPPSEAAANEGQGFAKSPGTSYQYSLSGSDYCVTATSPTADESSLYLSSTTGSIEEGLCPGHTNPNIVVSQLSYEEVAIGQSHTCTIGSDDKAYCWGENYYGQLGNGNTADQTIPVAVSAGAMPAGAIKSIVTGSEHTCAIASDDKVYCWGENYRGQLGDGTTGDGQTTPVAVSAGAMPAGAVKSISAGLWNSCAIASDDKVYCWGFNGDGQLGNGNTTTPQTTPVAVLAGAMPAGAVKSIDTGDRHTCAIASDDKVYCWGINDYGELGNDDAGTSQYTPVAVSAGAMPAGAVKSLTVGSSHACAIASDDKAYCWGDNTYGPLGNGEDIPQASPVAVLAGDMPAGAVKSITAGYQYTCAIASDDKAYCWGSNWSGQLGNGNVAIQQTTPVAVMTGAMPAGAVKLIIAGYSHTCAIASDNKVYCLGSNDYGQLGNGNTTRETAPVAVSAGAIPAGAVKSIAAGDSHNCAIASDDKVYCWGSNEYGQIGNGIATDTPQTNPVVISAGAMPAGAVKSITAGQHHNCAIASDDKAYCWGSNSSGQLGRGNTTSPQTTPVAVLAGAMPVGAIKSITAGGSHTCAIASNDKVYCWGYNGYGQLGNGNNTRQTTPVAVSAGAMPVGVVKSITAGSDHTCAIASDDKVYCWGYNYYGQLGNGNTGTNRNIPVAVLAGAMPAGAVKSIKANGSSYTCAIASDNKAYCWGNNTNGQLGNDGSDSNLPVAVSAGAMPAGSVKSITLGGSHTCAIASDDKVYCWGDNQYGQLGNGNTTLQTTPVAVSDGAMTAGAVKSITVGGNHACAIASDDKAYCWGDNQYGQLGIDLYWAPGLVLPPL